MVLHLFSIQQDYSYLSDIHKVSTFLYLKWVKIVVLKFSCIKEVILVSVINNTRTFTFVFNCISFRFTFRVCVCCRCLCVVHWGPACVHAVCALAAGCSRPSPAVWRFRSASASVEEAARTGEISDTHRSLRRPEGRYSRSEPELHSRRLCLGSVRDVDSNLCKLGTWSVFCNNNETLRETNRNTSWHKHHSTTR